MSEGEGAGSKDLSQLAARCMRAAAERELAIVTAESCTGGELAALLTDLDGLAHVFERGFIVYSDTAKAECLGVRHALLGRCGAVSAEVAEAMAVGALERSTGDLAISITGYAGPTDDGGEEGSVFLSAARRGSAAVTVHRRFGAIGREAIRRRSLECALGLFIEQI